MRLIWVGSNTAVMIIENASINGQQWRIFLKSTKLPAATKWCIETMLRYFNARHQDRPFLTRFFTSNDAWGWVIRILKRSTFQEIIINSVKNGKNYRVVDLTCMLLADLKLQSITLQMFRLMSQEMWGKNIFKAQMNLMLLQCFRVCSSDPW